MFDRPTLATLVQRVRADVLSRLQTDDLLRRTDADVLARVMAGVSHGLYGFVQWLSDQIIYDTASAEYLERWASIWGVQRKPASSASGSVSLIVQAGAVVPVGTLVQALDGTRYQTTGAATGAAPTLTAPLAAVEPGAAGNRDAGQALALVSPLIGVQPTGTASLLSGGADVETDDALRARLLARIQQPPQGGALADYRAWALSVPGVTRAWVAPQELGPGTVTVRFVRDNDGTGAAIIPDAPEVAAVQAVIDTLRPVTAQAIVVAPVAVPLDFTISGLTPGTVQVQAAVQAELADLLLRESVPGGTLLLSHIRAAISAAAGETDFVLTAPASNVVSAPGVMSIMGAVTWA